MNKVKAKILYLPNYDRTWGDMGYAHATDSAFDVRACQAEDITLAPMERVKIPLGFCLQLEPGYGWQIRSRSSTGAKGLSMPNGVGTIDNGYLGEVSILVINLSGAPFKVERGMRIGQVVIEPIYHVAFEEISSPDGFEFTTRGTGGFGSTGV
ncbi:MAG: dUTP diphosphatase [Rickettsiales bacterium]|jgi:dUTP pyrophosphatase|nr:dUTP diphosphatase [Rickettsiales bacterium]